MSNPVRTAIFPVAGLGTRFLPATKATPKELLPVIDTPLIQIRDRRGAGGRDRADGLCQPPVQGRDRALRDG